jgi:hypothetical protein
LSLISEYVESKTGLEFDAFTARVVRIDYCRNLNLSTEPKVSKAFYKLTQKFLLHKRVIEDSTLYYGTKSRAKEICIYSKFRDSLKKCTKPGDIEKAKGILRFEMRYREIWAITSLVKKLKLKDSTAKTLLNENVSNQVMSKVLEDLNFANLLTNDETNLAKLRKIYSMSRAMRLSGFLDAVTQYGEDFYKDKSHKIARSSYFDNVRLCKKADAWNRSKSLE